MKKIIRLFSKFLLFILMFSLIFLVINGIVENGEIDRQISDFISKGVCSEEVINTASGDIVLCKVSRETYYPDEIEKEIIDIDQNSVYVGSVGDILVRKKSSYGIPAFAETVSYFIGGHAAMVGSTNTQLVEVAGNISENYVRLKNNNWFFNSSTFMGLRVKGASLEDYQKAYENATSHFGEKYNYSFVFNTKKTKYCTDLMHKAWYENGLSYNLNDGFVTTINDLICSDKTYISFYKYKENNVHYFYYID